MTSHPSTNAVKPDTPPASSPRQPYLDIMNALGDQPGESAEVTVAITLTLLLRPTSALATGLASKRHATRLKNLPYHGHRYISGDVSSVPHLLARPRLDSASAQFEAADADLMKDASRKPGCIVPLGFLTAVLAALGPDTYLN
ncbi:hypothetical protein WG66_005619 [Moniliophthora roreri]|nr:hypothetical protein WG66_005619 [Moniliophthora roreri]